MLIREAILSDAAGVGALAVATGQPSEDSGADSRYYDLLLQTGTVLVAESEDGVVGWGAVRTRFGASMLTDLFVHPAHHGRGVGARLLDALWPSGAGASRRRFTFSSLHPHALPLYVRSGLAVHWPLLYLVGPGASAPSTDLAVTVVAPEEAADVEMRLAGTGASPDVLLYRYWAGVRTSAALVVSDGGRMVACAALRPGEVAHVSCAGDADAVGVVAASVSAAGQEVRLCVPGPHPALRALLGWGFEIEDMDLAMSSGMPLPATGVYSPGLA